jgi:8-oxo-dGTP pyrophosphatase MutT (NUDIX family)
MSDPSLLTVLESYQPWNGTEAAHHAAFLHLLRTHPAPFNRYSYQPGHITGSTWILAEDTAQVALIYHRRLERWLQPGGHAGPGETDSISTALREAREELGLILDPARANLFDLDVHQIPATAKQPSHLHFDIRYLCRIEQQTLVSDSDALTARWFRVAELEVMKLDEAMRRMLIKGLNSANLNQDG